MNCKSVYLKCDCYAETVEFNKYTFSDDEINYEMNFIDSYCGYDFMGIKNRFKRAWKAFWAKPICFTGVYCQDKERMKKFLRDCLTLMEE